MSSNNQTLIKKHKDKYYVFENVMAESWEETNELDINEHKFASESFSDAIKFAHDLDKEEHTEYGVVIDVLAKDRAEVKIINKLKQ
jgi:hypothetical protein